MEQKVKEEKKKRTERFAKGNTVKKRKRRPGQKLGHAGMARSLPDHIDEVIEEAFPTPSKPKRSLWGASKTLEALALTGCLANKYNCARSY